ncbi:hypothetical protein REPUB_Repub08aG0032100 [Reevesia pubescens]
MEAKGVKLGLMLVVVVAMMMGFLVLGPNLVEGAFGIQLNPCTLPQCMLNARRPCRRNSSVQPVLQVLRGTSASV